MGKYELSSSPSWHRYGDIAEVKPYKDAFEASDDKTAVEKARNLVFDYWNHRLDLNDNIEIYWKVRDKETKNIITVAPSGELRLRMFVNGKNRMNVVD